MESDRDEAREVSKTKLCLIVEGTLTDYRTFIIQKAWEIIEGGYSRK